MSHIDQDNSHIKKEKWRQWVDVYFEKVTSHDIDESDSNESDSEEYEDKKHSVGNTKEEKQTDGNSVLFHIYKLLIWIFSIIIELLMSKI